MTKNTTKKAMRAKARTRPSHRAGFDPGGTTRSLVSLKEASPEDEERCKAHRDDQQQDRNRRRAVEVCLGAEGEDVCELVERIVLRHNASAGKAEDLRF